MIEGLRNRYIRPLVIRKKTTDDLLGYSLIFNCLSYGVKAIASWMNLQQLSALLSIVVFAIWIVFLVLHVAFRHRIIIKIVKWEFFYCLFLLINYLCFPHTQIYYYEYFVYLRQIIIVFIPCAAALSIETDFSRTWSVLRRYAVFCSLFMYIAIIMGYIRYWGYQTFGVYFMPLPIIMFYSALKNNKLFDKVLLIINTILVFLGGRQSVFVVTITFLVLFYFIKRPSPTKNVLFVFSGITIVFLYIILSESIFQALSDLGIYSRTLESINSGTFFSFDTRFSIYYKSLNIIKTNGNRISGLFADRLYLREMAGWITYAHNFFLEVLIDYGIIFGTIIISIFLLKISITLFKVKEERKILFFVIFSLGFIRLLVSNSFAIAGTFYLIFGFIFNSNN